MKLVKVPVEVLLAGKREHKKKNRKKVYEPVINLVIGDQALEFTDFKKAKRVYNAAHAYVRNHKIVDYSVAMRRRNGKIYVFKKPQAVRSDERHSA